MKLTTVSLCALGGIFPLFLLPTLPGSWAVGILLVLACLSGLLRCKVAQCVGLLLLFFLWGIMSAKQSLWMVNTLPAATQEAIVELTATDNMATHAGQITHL